MMGFYVAVALIATLTTTGNDHAPHSQAGVIGVVWGTTVGLALAHWFAVLLSARVVKDPDLHHTPAEMLFSQLVMAVGVATVATLVILVLSPDLERFGARLTAALFIAGLVAFESRAQGRTWGRAVTYGLVALAVGLVIAAFKLFVGK